MKDKSTHPLIDHRPRFYPGRVGNSQCQDRVLTLVWWIPQILQSRLRRRLAYMLQFLWQILHFLGQLPFKFVDLRQEFAPFYNRLLCLVCSSLVFSTKCHSASYCKPLVCWSWLCRSSISLRSSKINWAFKSYAALLYFILAAAKQHVARTWPNFLMASRTKWFSSWAISFSFSSARSKTSSRNVVASRLGFHRFPLLELFALPSRTTIISRGGFWPSEGVTWWEGARPFEWECLVGAAIAFLFLVKTSLEVVSSSSVGAWVVVVTSLSFCVGTLAASLILSAISSSSFLLNLDNIFRAKKKVNA